MSTITPNTIQWIPISNPPIEDKRYLIHAESADEDLPLIQIAWYNPNSKMWTLITNQWANAITHWAELPNPPGR